MESVNDVKQALSARSRTATLDELRNEGRKKVRLIKAEHVAAMITEAVHAAIEHSGLIPQNEVDKLVERSRQEFREILKEREQEALEAREIKEKFEAQGILIAELQEQVMAARNAVGGTAPGAAAAVGAPGAAGAAPAIAGGADLAAALEKLSGTINERLESIGKKMGISAAVEGDAVNFDGLFRSDEKELESNLDNVQIKQKAGGGIAANLAKLKKLKGGG